MNKIRGLTLIRPWGYAIAHLGKDVENRTWNCYLKPGDFIAIHNGKKWDQSAIECMADCMDIEAKVTPELDKDSQIIAVATFAGNVTQSNSTWFVGPIGWVLEDVTLIDPVECKGRQGLWNIPDDVLPHVRRNYHWAKKQQIDALGKAA